MKLDFNINGIEIICSGDIDLLLKSRIRVMLKNYGYDKNLNKIRFISIFNQLLT